MCGKLYEKEFKKDIRTYWMVNTTTMIDEWEKEKENAFNWILYSSHKIT